MSTEAEAVAVLGAGAVSLLLLDADTGGGACWRVLRTLLRAQNRAPVVLLADGKDMSSRVRALEAGCADLLAKPVSGAELVARLSGVLRGARLREFFRACALGEPAALVAEGVSVQDVISGVSQGNASGLLALSHARDDAAGALWVTEGQLTAARYGGAQASDSLLLASMRPPDRYQFDFGNDDAAEAEWRVQGTASELIAALDVRVASWQQLEAQLPSLDQYVWFDVGGASDADVAGECAWASEIDGTKTLFALLSAGKRDILRAAADVARLHALGALRTSSQPIAAGARHVDPRAFGAISTRQGSFQPSVIPRTVVRPASVAPLSRTTTLAPPSSVSGSAWLSPSVGPSNGVVSDEIPLPSSSAVLLLEEDLSSVHDLSLYDMSASARASVEPVMQTAQVATIREHALSDAPDASRLPPAKKMATDSEPEDASLSEAERVARAWPSSDSELAESGAAIDSGRRSGRVVAAAFLALLLAVSGALVYARREVRGKGEVDAALLDAGLGEPSSLAVSGTFARTEQAAAGARTLDAGGVDAPAVLLPAASVASEAVDAAGTRVGVDPVAPTLPPKTLAPSPGGVPLLSRKQLETALDRGQFKRVIEQGERAVDANPQDGEIWALIGVAYQATGQGPKSKDAYANCAKYASGQTKAECARYAR